QHVCPRGGCWGPFRRLWGGPKPLIARKSSTEEEWDAIPAPAGAPLQPPRLTCGLHVGPSCPGPVEGRGLFCARHTCSKRPTSGEISLFAKTRGSGAGPLFPQPQWTPGNPPPPSIADARAAATSSNTDG